MNFRLPTPIQRDDTRHDVDYYTRDQLVQALKDWSEECALVCEEHLEFPSLTPKDCAEAIREKAKELK